MRSVLLACGAFNKYNAECELCCLHSLFSPQWLVHAHCRAERQHTPSWCGNLGRVLATPKSLQPVENMAASLPNLSILGINNL